MVTSRDTKLSARKAILRIVAVCLVLLGGAGYIVFFAPNDFPEDGVKTMYVSKGQPFSSVADSLEAAGIIRSRSRFDLVARLVGGAEKVKIGKYVFASGISNLDLFLSLRDGKGATLVSVTLPEGLRARSYAAILSAAIGIDAVQYEALASDSEFARTLGVEGGSLEGYLMPDTYHFSWQPDEESIIRRQVEQFKLVYSDSLAAQTQKMGWTMHQVVTLASIVEGEAVLDSERARIAGVYHNRLRKGMKLQADPTVQYIFADGPRRVHYSDLKIDHPYNTYRIKGLPPGPVSNPRKASIIAVLFPENHNYLFFVANGKGGHWFSSTFAQHIKHKRAYRRARAQQEAMISPRAGERDTAKPE